MKTYYTFFCLFVQELVRCSTTTVFFFTTYTYLLALSNVVTLLSLPLFGIILRTGVRSVLSSFSLTLAYMQTSTLITFESMCGIYYAANYTLAICSNPCCVGNWKSQIRVCVGLKRTLVESLIITDAAMTSFFLDVTISEKPGRYL